MEVDNNFFRILNIEFVKKNESEGEGSGWFSDYTDTSSSTSQNKEDEVIDSSDLSVSSSVV